MAYRNRRIRWDRVIGAFVFLIFLIFLIGWGVSSCTKSDENEDTPKINPISPLSSETAESSADYVIGGDNTSSSSAAPAETTAPPEDSASDFVNAVQMAGDVYGGNLVLVNKDNPSHLTKEDLDLVLVARNGEYDQKYAGIYNVSYPAYVLYNTNALSWFNKMISAYYAQTSNTEIMFNYGYLAVDDKKANPESACGLDIQLHLKTNRGSYAPVTNAEPYSWIFSNMFKYGFVQRYPEGKEDKTGVKGTYAALRYVGIPHAAYMHENNLCLEEYLDLLKEKYAYGTGLLNYSYNEQDFTIYYVPASTTGDTDVPVPVSGNYEISGNNIDGYIVTAIS